MERTKLKSAGVSRRMLFRRHGFRFLLPLGFLAATLPAARSAAPMTGDPVDCVNPLSGTNGDAEFSRGNTVPAIVAPFGMTTWAPQTDGSVSPFYQMKHARFEGIRATHQPSIWVRDYGNFLIMPVVGPWQGSSKDRASDFRRLQSTRKSAQLCFPCKEHGDYDCAGNWSKDVASAHQHSQKIRGQQGG